MGTAALPGTARKVEELARRMAAGLPLFEADDVVSDPRRHLDWEQRGNGARVVRGEAIGRPEPGEKPMTGGMGFFSGHKRSRLLRMGIRHCLAERLRALRLGRPMTQGELALASGVAQSSISRLEQGGCPGGRTAADVYTLIALADALGVSLDELVGRRRRRR